MMWLFESVTALFPSVYLESADAAVNIRAVDKQLAEARRVRDKVATATGRHASDLPIYTFTWMDCKCTAPFVSSLEASKKRLCRLHRRCVAVCVKS